MKRINISDENIRKIETAAVAIAVYCLSSYAWYMFGKNYRTRNDLDDIRDSIASIEIFCENYI